MAETTPAAPAAPAANSHIAQVFSRDMEDARERFEAWVKSRFPADARAALVAFHRPQASGLSHELISADIRWLENGEQRTRELILRLDPIRYRKRHSSNLRREFDVLSVLQRLGATPVPTVYWYETEVSIFGAEFYAMERIEGWVTGDPPQRAGGPLAAITPQERRQLWENSITTLAQIHLTPLGALEGLRREPGDDDIDQTLRYWRKTYDWGTQGQSHPLANRGWAWLEANRPGDHPVGLSWGDAHPRNMIFRDLQPVAVVDWEDVALSSPVFDLARWFMAERMMLAGAPMLEGIPSPREVIQSWELKTGFSAASLRWFMVLACCGGFGTLSRTLTLQKEMFGKAVSLDGRLLTPMATVLEELLDGRDIFAICAGDAPPS